jgi:RNA polymerase sigma-70 factor (ECF subfamily)
MEAQTHPVDEDVTALFLDNLPSLERYARSLTRDPEAAADVCQEVFIRFLVHARGGPMPDVPAAWMHRVAHNVVVSAARRRTTRERTAVQLAKSEHVASTEDAAIYRERDDFVRTALSAVRPFEREAIVLAAQGYRSDEIGDRLGRTAASTRTMLCRARGQLRAQLQAFDPA